MYIGYYQLNSNKLDKNYQLNSNSPEVEMTTLIPQGINSINAFAIINVRSRL